MSIQSEINRINSNIADTYTALGERGATMPSVQNSDNLAETVGTIPTEEPVTLTGTALPGQVLSGKTFYNTSTTPVTGTMPNNGAVSKSITPSTASQTYTIPAGYHNGSGKVTVAKSQLKTYTTTATSASTTTSVKSTAGTTLSRYALTIPLNFTHTLVGLWVRITGSDTSYYQCNSSGDWTKCNYTHFIDMAEYSGSDWKTKTSLTVYVGDKSKTFDITAYYI